MCCKCMHLKNSLMYDRFFLSFVLFCFVFCLFVFICLFSFCFVFFLMGSFYTEVSFQHYLQHYLWFHRQVCCDKILSMAVKSSIGINGKSRFDQLATAFATISPLSFTKYPNNEVGTRIFSVIFMV